MNKWLLMRGGEIVSCIMSVNEPNNQNGYDTEGLDVVEVSEFKPTSKYTYSVDQSEWVLKLDDLIEKAILKVEEYRESEQMKVLTLGQAKNFVYFHKAKEVEEILKLDPEAPIDLDNFPFIKSEAEASQQSYQEIVAEIQSATALSIMACAEIEAEVQSIKRLIREATSEVEIGAALNSLNIST